MKVPWNIWQSLDFELHSRILIADHEACVGVVWKADTVHMWFTPIFHRFVKGEGPLLMPGNQDHHLSCIHGPFPRPQLRLAWGATLEKVVVKEPSILPNDGVMGQCFKPLCETRERSQVRWRPHDRQGPIPPRKKLYPPHFSQFSLSRNSHNSKSPISQRLPFSECEHFWGWISTMLEKVEPHVMMIAFRVLLWQTCVHIPHHKWLMQQVRKLVLNPHTHPCWRSQTFFKRHFFHLVCSSISFLYIPKRACLLQISKFQMPWVLQLSWEMLMHAKNETSPVGKPKTKGLVLRRAKVPLYASPRTWQPISVTLVVVFPRWAVSWVPNSVFCNIGDTKITEQSENRGLGGYGVIANDWMQSAVKKSILFK